MIGHVLHTLSLYICAVTFRPMTRKGTVTYYVSLTNLSKGQLEIIPLTGILNVYSKHTLFLNQHYNKVTVLRTLLLFHFLSVIINNNYNQRLIINNPINRDPGCHTPLINCYCNICVINYLFREMLTCFVSYL
jgi:hypothetical protein